MNEYMIDKRALNAYVGRKIRELRKMKGLTQKELGDKIGVKDNTISSYENGTNSLDQTTLYKLSRVLDCKMDDFFPPGGMDVSDELERALALANNLDSQDIMFLKKLIEKVLSLQGEEKEKFLDSLRFTIDYFENEKKKK